MEEEAAVDAALAAKAGRPGGGAALFAAPLSAAGLAATAAAAAAAVATGHVQLAGGTAQEYLSLTGARRAHRAAAETQRRARSGGKAGAGAASSLLTRVSLPPLPSPRQDSAGVRERQETVLREMQARSSSSGLRARCLRLAASLSRHPHLPPNAAAAARPRAVGAHRRPGGAGGAAGSGAACDAVR